MPFGVNNTDGAEVDSPIPDAGEMRLQSDFALARDQVCCTGSLVPINFLFTVAFVAHGVRMAEHGGQPATHDEQLRRCYVEVGYPWSQPRGPR